MHYYLIPVASAVIWTAMLITFLVCWSVQGKPIYWFMSSNDTMIYLSDIAATNLQPLFISCALAHGLLFIAGLATEIYFRFLGKLLKYTNNCQRLLSMMALLFLVAGQLGLLLCSILDIAHHHRVHVAMTFMFMVGVFLFCVFMLASSCSLYTVYVNRRQELGESSRWNYILVSVVLKAIWTAAAIAFGLTFAILMRTSKHNISGYFEWVVAFWYTFLPLLLAYDMLPATATDHGYYGRGKKDNFFDQRYIKHQANINMMLP